MTIIIDPQYFHELAEQDPENVCRRALCTYDAERLSYTLMVWGDHYSIYPKECKVDRITDNLPVPSEIFNNFILHYLLRSRESRINNDWISERGIPGGVMFFRVSHEIPTHLITERYGNDIDDFRKTCEQLQGIPLDMADASYKFFITPRIPVAVLFWAGDEDFPSQSKVLFDKSLAEFLAPDIVFALAVEVCSRIGNTWKLYNRSGSRFLPM